MVVPSRSVRTLAASGCLSVMALAMSACGGSSGSSSSSADTGAATSTPSTKTTSAGGNASLAAGKKVFVANCGGCHTLANADAGGQVGPNLDDLKPDMATVVHQVTNGGGGMPAFGSQLSATQIQAVARYVSSVAGKGGGSGLPTGGAP
jgi:mono/diheme cytochrome c family protein